MFINAMQTAILRFLRFPCPHLWQHGDLHASASIVSRFLAVLEEGVYREMSYYADRLCITSKYQSEVSKKVSGYATNHWINRYTTLDISRQLRNKPLAFVQISDMFGFSSPAYFSCYVQQPLGVKRRIIGSSHIFPLFVVLE